MTDASAPLDPPLRVDWLGSDGEPGRVGLTILPGKHGPSTRYPGRVYRRDVEGDLATLGELGVRHLILLVEDDELERWGNLDIVKRGDVAGVQIHRFPMVDGGTPRDLGEMQEILNTISAGRRDGNVAVACMGGVGRSGMVAACHLVTRGQAPRDAIATVRAIRHPEAVETHVQEQVVLRYAAFIEAARSE